MPTALETVTISSGDARVLLAPERGGIATRFTIGDREVFYLDEATLLDTTKNVRGGNPVLFPSPGKLENDRWARDGREGSMGQHGFARNSVWTVTDAQPSAVTLRLVSSDATREAYPWDFVATYRYALTGRALRIEQRFETSGDAPMPFGAGFHPYFHVTNKAAVRIPTNATRAWDNTAKKAIDLGAGKPIDLTRREVDLHLIDHGLAHASLELGDGRRIDVRCSDELTRWVVWTLEGKDFVCLEPWTCAANALNSGEGLLFAKRDAPITLWTEIEMIG